MCNSRMTTLRYLKVVVPILLYRAMQLAISVAIGATAFSLHVIAEIPLSILLASMSLTALPVIAIDFRFPGKNAYHLVSSLARLGSIAIGLATFLFFRNLSIPQSGLINWGASHTFGLLLFRTNSIGRRYLWEPGGLFDTQAAHMSTLPHLMLYSFFAVVFVMVVGTVFDAVVASLIECLLYKMLSKSECRS